MLRPFSFNINHQTSTIPMSLLGSVHSVESCGTVDGPGIRFILFLAGCSLRCRYCHNPDTSFKCTGKERTVEDVMEEIGRYESFLKAAGGGITISGGDPLFQPEFTKAILQACKERGLHTCIDTSGHLGEQADAALLDATDLVLLDIKAWNPEQYRRLTGQELQPTLDFAERLAALHKPVWLRYVLVPGWTDNHPDIEQLARYAHGLGNIERVDVLPFHQMGQFKWAELGLTYSLGDVEPPEPELTKAVKEIFRANGFAHCTK